LPASHLHRLLTRYAVKDPSVIVGPGVGEDTAVVALSPGAYLVTKSDPITFATDEIGWYAVHVNANDIACAGARPRWWMATVLLPEGSTTAALVDEIFAQMDRACVEVGALLVGGHTEITYGLSRPIVVGTMLGQVMPDQVITTSGARPGDRLILTKGIAVEGTAIIAREKRTELEATLSSELLDRCAALLHQPGISVVRDAQLALLSAPGGVHAMHDPTEGGVATGLHELAQACGCGLEIQADALPVLPETRLVCRALGLDPLGVIASGSLLVAAQEESVDAIVRALGASGIDATPIGRVLPPGTEVWVNRGSERHLLPTFARDEVARLFDRLPAAKRVRKKADR